MSLVSNLKIVFPGAPSPNQELRAISNGLNDAIKQSVISAFVPGVFTAKVQSIPGLTPSMIGLFSYLAPLAETVIGSALAAQAVPATSAPIVAWSSVKGQIMGWPPYADLKGTGGSLFWQAIQLTIFNATPGVPEPNL